MSIDSRSFRRALGCFASGVTVVTTLTPETRSPVGVTVSAFSSLSLEPPMVLFCLGNQTSTLNSFERSGHFGINVLAEGQRDLSNRFASRAEDKWAGVPCETWDTGSPILLDCLANMECKLVNVVDGGDHRIFIGEVLRLRHQEGGLPLVYFRGGYMDFPSVPSAG